MSDSEFHHLSPFARNSRLSVRRFGVIALLYPPFCNGPPVVNHYATRRSSEQSKQVAPAVDDTYDLDTPIDILIEDHVLADDQIPKTRLDIVTRRPELPVLAERPNSSRRCGRAWRRRAVWDCSGRRGGVGWE